MKRSKTTIVEASNTCGCDEGGVATQGIMGREGADDYAIPQDVWDAPSFISCDVLISAGGVYGNPFAMQTISRMAEAERSRGADVCVVYNGDYHWFDGTADNFCNIERLLEGCIPLNGNVECELARIKECGVGCGCSYPISMSDAFVGRSNAIFTRMRNSVRERNADLFIPLRERPCWGVAEAAGLRVGLTHGDERSVSGWGCSTESLHNSKRQRELEDFFRRHDIDVLSTTHTCAAAALALPDGIVINNGSAGIPEYNGMLFGLVNRIAKTSSPDALYSIEFKGAIVEAVPVRYDHDAFVSWFDGVWNADSPAAKSYRARIMDGPANTIADAIIGDFTITT